MPARLQHLRGLAGAWAFGTSVLVGCDQTDEGASGGDIRLDTDAAPLCQPGHFQSSQGCTPCALNTWSDGHAVGQCYPKQACELGTYVASEGGVSQDRSCQLCPSNTTTVALNQSTCEPGCLAGFQWVEDARCEACSPGHYCEGATTAAAPCEGDRWDNDGNPATPCVALSICQPGWYRLSPGGGLTDTQCQVCEAGTYSEVSNAPVCQPWTVCERDEVEATPGSTTSDLECKPFEWLKPLESIREQVPYSVRVGPDGDVYVGGTRYIEEASRRGAMLRRYTPEGELVWEWMSPQHLGGAVFDLVVTEDQVVLVGETEPVQHDLGDGVYHDGFITALRPEDGQLLWSEVVSTPEEDSVQGVALGAFGDIYVVGNSEGMNPTNDPTLTKRNGFIRKYSPQGVLQWARVVGTAADDTLSTIRITQELGEVVYAFGSTSGQYPGYPMAQAVDTVLVKYTDEGTLAWLRQIPGGSQDVISTLSDRKIGGHLCLSHAARSATLLESVDIICLDAVNHITRRTTLIEAVQEGEFFAPKRVFSTPSGGLWMVGETYFDQEGDRYVQLSVWTLNQALEVIDRRTLTSDLSLIALSASLSPTEPALYTVGYAINEEEGEVHGYLHKYKVD